MNANKCEVIASAWDAHTVSRDLFNGWSWEFDGSVKILGAPFGDVSYYEEVLAKRVAKANRLLSCLADFKDAQGALHLVRNCASWCKVVYACRIMPPNLQTHALFNFTANLRNILNTIVGKSVDDRS